MGESSLDPKARNTAISCKSNWVLLRECTLLVLPMVTFSAILLGLVIYHQWHRHHAALRGLELSAEFSSSIFYVDYSATRLILVASWSSSTVFALMGSFMTLLSFPIASDMIRNSRGPSLDLLPTPNQLALLIDLLDGKKGALWPWAMGLWKRKENRTRSVWALESSAALLIFAVVLRSVQSRLQPFHCSLADSGNHKASRLLLRTVGYICPLNPFRCRITRTSTLLKQEQPIGSLECLSKIAGMTIKSPLKAILHFRVLYIVQAQSSGLCIPKPLTVSYSTTLNRGTPSIETTRLGFHLSGAHPKHPYHLVEVSWHCRSVSMHRRLP